MQLKYTYGARSMLDQLTGQDRADTEAAINRIHVDLTKNTPPQNVMDHVSLGAASDVYVAGAGDRWRIYFKVTEDELFVEDIVSSRQLKALRMAH